MSPQIISTRRRRKMANLLLALMIVLGFGGDALSPALALSELKTIVPEPDGNKVAPSETLGAPEVPIPDPGSLLPKIEIDGGVDNDPLTSDDAPIEILYDFSLLPEGAQRMRQLIIDAAKTGKLEALRPLLGIGPSATNLSISPYEGDPIEFLRDMSGDKDGQETLAILLDLLDSGFVLADKGTTSEHYLWPYFFALPLEDLSPPQKVELFRLVTAGDYQAMLEFGGYSFYRTGITPAGEWLFLLAGD